MGYHDALILAAARLAGCGTVYSEDLASGQDYGGTRVVNPLVAFGSDGVEPSDRRGSSEQRMEGCAPSQPLVREPHRGDFTD